MQMSQNEYLQQVNGFAVGLKKALGDDEEAAAMLADRIVTAEADIVAATGNSAEAVQNAFNGVMRGNYTMLDNLGLGINATKEGMQEVIDIVNKANGTNYNINNIADVQQALIDYVDKQNMAGYALDEGAKTLSGSLATLKASWENLLIGLGSGDSNAIAELVEQLIDSGKKFGERAIPVVEGILDGMITASEALIPELVEMLGEYAPELVDAAVQILETLVTAIITNLPLLASAAVEIIGTILGGIASVINDLIGAGADVVGKVIAGAKAKADDLIQAGKDFVSGLITGIKEKAEDLPAIAKEFITDKIKNFVTGKSGFDEHSPSKWSEGVGAFLMKGLGIGIKDGSGEVMKTMVDVINALKAKTEKTVSVWADKIDILSTQYEVWEKQVGDTVTAAEKLQKKSESLNGQIELQEKTVAGMLAVWEKLKKQYGVNSAEAISYQKEILKEKDALADLKTELQGVNDELSKGTDFSGIVGVIDAQYELWTKTGGQVADMADVFATNADMLTHKLAALNGEAQEAEETFKDAERIYGVGSQEANAAKIDWYNALSAVADIKNEIESNNKAAKEANALGGVSQVNFEDSAIAKTSEATVNAMNKSAKFDLSLVADMVTPDGRTLAQWLLKPLIDAANANGTPIVNPAF